MSRVQQTMSNKRRENVDTVSSSAPVLVRATSNDDRYVLLPPDDNCTCVDPTDKTTNPRTFDFCYRQQENTTINGKRFDCAFVPHLQVRACVYALSESACRHSAFSTVPPERNTRLSTCNTTCGHNQHS
jgi:hypothetical protein